MHPVILMPRFRSLAGFVALIAVALSGLSCEISGPGIPSDAAPRNVILFISDGCGPASFTLARDYGRSLLGRETLALDALQTGSIHTYATDSRITDSASSATAYACGVKTYNGAIGVDTLRQPLATLVEAAEARGMATGLVATSRITHATPAAFSAHVPDRGMETDIAAQQIEQDIDVLFGGGLGFYRPADQDGARDDGRDLIAEAEAAGYQIVLDAAGFAAPLQTPVLGLFSDSHMAYDIDRDPAAEPSLAEMTTTAINLLQNNPNGFFLMVEGSRIDHAAHANDPAAHLHDILAYDAAVAAALDFARTDGQTLIVATSDHETGGLTLGRRLDDGYSGTWYPDVLSRVHASHEQMLRDVIENRLDPIEAVTAEMGVADLDAAETARLRQDAATPDALNLTVSEIVSRRAGLGWSTGGHTAVDVNLYAFGPGQDAFAGHHDNTYIGTTLARLLDFNLAAATDRLRTMKTPAAAE